MVSCRIHGVKNLTAQGKRREREGADARREERKEVIVSSGSTVPPGPILLTPGRATRAQRYLLCSTHSVKNTLCSDQSLKDYVVHAQQLRKWSPQLSVCVPISISICVSDPLSLSSSLSLYPLFRSPPQDALSPCSILRRRGWFAALACFSRSSCHQEGEGKDPPSSGHLEDLEPPTAPCTPDPRYTDDAKNVAGTCPRRALNGFRFSNGAVWCGAVRFGAVRCGSRVPSWNTEQQQELPRKGRKSAGGMERGWKRQTKETRHRDRQTDRQTERGTGRERARENESKRDGTGGKGWKGGTGFTSYQDAWPASADRAMTRRVRTQGKNVQGGSL